MRKFILYLIFSLFISQNVYADIKKKNWDKIVDAAYVAKTCILSLRSDLYEYKGMLLREYEYVVQQVLRSKNHGATNFNMYISDFGEIHYKAITTATSNCERFPY